MAAAATAETKGDNDNEQRVYSISEVCNKSKHTARTYRIALENFFRSAKVNDIKILLDLKPSVVEAKIIDHVNYLKNERRLSYRSILVHLSAIFLWLEANDYNIINRKKIKRLLPADESERYGNDRAYSLKEIEQILSKCDVRSRAAVLIMVSAGLRLDGLRTLRIGDLQKMDEFSLYMIKIYAGTRDAYYSFCSPEASAAIDEWLSHRAKHHELMKDKSPLIRDKCRADSYFRAPKFLSLRGISLMFEGVLKKAKVDPKHEVSRTHGFRKYFISSCDRSGLSFQTREYLSGHRLPNQDAAYIRVSEEDRLAEYVKALPILTISNDQRLAQENRDLKTVQAQEIAQQAQEIQRLREDFNHYKEEVRNQDHVDMNALDEFEVRNKANLKKQYGIDYEFEWVTPERAKELQEKYNNKD
jgi:integrase